MLACTDCVRLLNNVRSRVLQKRASPAADEVVLETEVRAQRVALAGP